MPETIEKLKKADLEEAIRVYSKGSKMQNPEGNYNLDDIEGRLGITDCYVHKDETGRIDGLVSYIVGEKEIEIEFICSLKKGAGKKLMGKIAELAKDYSIPEIRAEVSSIDQKAVGFYDSLGFKKSKEYPYENIKVYEIKAKPDDIMKKVRKK